MVTDHQIYYQERVVRLLDYMVREEMLDNLVMTVLMILLGHWVEEEIQVLL